MSNLSRRSLVASAAALPALAMPVIANAASDPDPIFAAIQACIAAERADAQALFRLEAARDQFKQDFGTDVPSPFSKDLREAWAQQP